jgi:hypothetical protein
MGKQRTVHGAYTSDSLGKDGTGPLKVTEMDPRRTKAFTCKDGVDLTGQIDCNSNEVSNWGLAAILTKRRR